MKRVGRIIGILIGALLLGMLTSGSYNEAQAGDGARQRSQRQGQPSEETPSGMQSFGRPLFSPPPFVDRSAPISERPFAKPFIDRGPSMADRPLAPIGGGGQVAPHVLPRQPQQVLTPGSWMWCGGQWVWGEGHRHDGDACSSQ
ncbi:MAG: hypothetical protein HYZ81_16300 [Nitrospinae bacterium]|nr:hypothetical protein [Nitrospinota bacterium]